MSIITPETPAPMTREQRLASYDVSKHGGEVMASPRTGAEKCCHKRLGVMSSTNIVRLASALS